MIDTFAKITSGDHVALIYRTRREQLAYSIPFIKRGLAANERCLYIADSNPGTFIRQALADAGIDVDEAERRQALSIVTKQETYLRYGLFEPTRVLADLDHWISESLEMGFKGLRVAGEMTWALDLPSSFTALVDYAKQLDERRSAAFVALCQFDETRFPAPILEQIVAAHSKVIRGGALIKDAAQP